MPGAILSVSSMSIAVYKTRKSSAGTECLITLWHLIECNNNNNNNNKKFSLLSSSSNPPTTSVCRWAFNRALTDSEIPSKMWLHSDIVRCHFLYFTHYDLESAARELDEQYLAAVNQVQSVTDLSNNLQHKLFVPIKEPLTISNLLFFMFQNINWLHLHCEQFFCSSTFARTSTQNEILQIRLACSSIHLAESKFQVLCK